MRPLCARCEVYRASRGDLCGYCARALVSDDVPVASTKRLPKMAHP